MPDRRAGEAVDDVDAELRAPRARVSVIPSARAPAHALRIAVAPDVGRQDRLVALVDPVAHGLADEVVADRPALQPVALEQLAALGT